MRTRKLDDHCCELCSAQALVEYPDFTAFPRVTSDAKPFPAGGRISVCTECGTIQKLVDEKWLGEIDEIYAGYTIYHQADGAEQPIFASGQGVGVPRSARLIDYMAEQLVLQAEGRVLDFGCGNGTALRSFGARFPGWSLYGSELHDGTLPALRQVPNFVELYTVPPERIPGRFDLITLFHALEHVIDPVSVLKSFHGLLEQAGSLFVEVPNNAQTPYDLLIADHMTHFTPQTLGFATELAGYGRVALTDRVLPKELTWVGSRAAVAAPDRPDPALGIDLLERHLSAIMSQMRQARELADANASFGIFGTSISATWLSNVLGDRIAFYVDEDPGRVGRRHMGKPILAPAAVPSGADVFLPLIPEVASAVARRLGGGGARYHEPGEAGLAGRPQ